MSFDPHCRTLVNKSKKPCRLQSILPDGTYLFRVGAGSDRLILVNKEGRSPDSGQTLLYDITKPKPFATPAPQGKLSQIVPGQTVYYSNPFSGAGMPLVRRGIAGIRQGACLTIKLDDGSTVKATAASVHLSLETFATWLKGAAAEVARLMAEDRQGAINAKGLLQYR